jgi:hypothetical protein
MDCLATGSHSHAILGCLMNLGLVLSPLLHACVACVSSAAGRVMHACVVGRCTSRPPRDAPGNVATALLQQHCCSGTAAQLLLLLGQLTLCSLDCVGVSLLAVLEKCGCIHGCYFLHAASPLIAHACVAAPALCLLAQQAVAAAAEGSDCLLVLLKPSRLVN